MRTRPVTRFEVLMLCLSCCVFAIPSNGKGEAAKNASEAGLGERIPQEFSFSLTRLPEKPNQYSLVLSDGDEKSISGIFSVDQLQILRAIMTEAEKFAVNDEAAGTKDPITTRFEDKQENAFVVDVEKSGNQSKLFLTLTSEIGRMTVDAGKVIRSTRREEGFFFDLLGRLESTLPKAAKPAK